MRDPYHILYVSLPVVILRKVGFCDIQPCFTVCTASNTSVVSLYRACSAAKDGIIHGNSIGDLWVRNLWRLGNRAPRVLLGLGGG